MRQVVKYDTAGPLARFFFGLTGIVVGYFSYRKGVACTPEAWKPLIGIASTYGVAAVAGILLQLHWRLIFRRFDIELWSHHSKWDGFREEDLLEALKKFPAAGKDLWWHFHFYIRIMWLLVVLASMAVIVCTIWAITKLPWQYSVAGLLVFQAVSAPLSVYWKTVDITIPNYSEKTTSKGIAITARFPPSLYYYRNSERSRGVKYDSRPEEQRV